MGKLDGKVAVITGGSSGMALETAKLFVEEGAHVFITGRRQEALDAAVKTIGRNVTGVRADSANLADLDRLYETVKSEKGQIDILFASAGGGEVDKPIGMISEQLVDDTLGLNVRGTLFTVQKALPLLRDGGSIILNASNAHLKGYGGASLYAAAKAAVRSFARSWANDLKERKIRVNSISPGAIGDTAAFAGIAKELTDFFVSLVPLGRFGISREIAAAVLYLASDDSRFTTGIDLVVDGGMSQV
ncbi:SDR family NAD(P)-dependent oxidoreductase [Radicibacter daui]|uniref:SDR family NAD(P)-dependent oxidoreductase n=1 Tax=Radicibacter daui TaxID=3064829 RepID=UPI004046B023